MKKLLYFLVAILTFSTASATDRTWIGTTSDWATASNWSPNGIPDVNDWLTIDNPTIAPVISNGTAAYALRITMRSGASLTIANGASLTLTNAERLDSYFWGISIRESELTNNGTLTANMPDAPDGGAVGVLFEGGTLTNSGIINTDGDRGIEFSGVNELTNLATGIINANGRFRGMVQNIYDGSTTNISNSGAINLSSIYNYTLALGEGTFSNSGTVTLSMGNGLYVNADAIFNNLSCGKVIIENVIDNIFTNDGTVINDGLIQVSRQVNNAGNITNNGILKYEGLSTTGGGALTNNGIIIDDKTDPIVQVGASNSSSIQGIYIDEAANTAAGTFTAPDQFSPSGLSPGDITLYAKIVSSGSACEYIVPFVYQAPALPVTLVNFSGKNTGNSQNTLTWLTSDEKNFAYFEIQRSSDARSFEAIGSVIHASEQGNVLKSYEFRDNQAPGMYYYRLKMIDRDGTYELSKIISVGEAAEKSVVVGSFYPNPSSGNVSVDVYAEASESWQIGIFDSSGKMITTESRLLQKGMNKITLNNLVKGVNVVKFGNGKSGISRKVVRR